jgi:hypothetical protein
MTYYSVASGVSESIPLYPSTLLYQTLDYSKQDTICTQS